MTEEVERPPRRLGHFVIETPDVKATYQFFVEGLGFRVSDIVAGGLAYFTRCSPDHHNLLFTPAPVPYLNHYAIERDDIDGVMKAAGGYLAENPGVQISGPGRHQIGGNVFWYLQDPAGNFFEQFADMDCIVDDDAWEIGSWDRPPWTLWGTENQPEVFFKPLDMADIIYGFHRQHGES
jgi:catechol 2,3-dioxygenase-like lactoylglutathione lyase family enzyme